MAKAVIIKTLMQICRPSKMVTMNAIIAAIVHDIVCDIVYNISLHIVYDIEYKDAISYTKMRYRIRYNIVYDIVYDIVYVLTVKFIPPALPRPPIFYALRFQPPSVLHLGHASAASPQHPQLRSFWGTLSHSATSRC